MNDYSDLLSAVADWTHRTDLAAKVPSFLALVETSFNRRLRCREMETALASTALASGQFTLPADFLSFKYLQSDTSPPQTLLLSTGEYLADLPSDNGIPAYYAINGTSRSCWPTGGSVKGVYYAKIPALTSTNTTNWLMTKYPDLYLFAVLEQAAIYTRDTMLEGVMSQRTERLINSVISDSRAAETSGGQLTVRIR